MSHLLLDNCHHNHCCHGNYTEVINQMMKTINQLQVKVDELSPKTWNGIVEFGGESNSTWYKTTDINNTTNQGKTYSTDVLFSNAQDIDSNIYIENNIISQSIQNLTQNEYEKIYNSTNCTIKLYSATDSATFTKVCCTPGVSYFMGMFSNDAINGSNYRLLLIKTNNEFKLGWYTARRNSTNLDTMIGNVSSSQSVSINMMITYT